MPSKTLGFTTSRIGRNTHCVPIFPPYSTSWSRQDAPSFSGPSLLILSRYQSATPQPRPFQGALLGVLLQPGAPRNSVIHNK